MVTNGSGSASESGPDSQPGWSPQPPPPPPPLDQVLLVTDKPWNPDALPPRPWIAPPYLMRGQITLPHGPGGVGKSQLIAAWTCSLALGDRKSTRMNSSHSQISYA